MNLFAQVLYMWSLDGAALTFPPSVSLPVGGNSTIQHLVLQVLLVVLVVLVTSG